MTSILAKTVSENERLAALRTAFRLPVMCALVENTTFNVLSRMSVEHEGKAYRGGYWEYVQLSNGGFFMYPAGSGHYRLRCDGNGADEIVDRRDAGIVASLFALNGLACRFPNDESLADRYYELLDYASELPTFGAIRRLID